jgi:uncharacterized protein (TIGR02145 family)
VNGLFVDNRDGQPYRTIKIGGQTWMAENLNYRGGDGGLGICFDSVSWNCTQYGRLYDWPAVMDCNAEGCAEHQGICPEGWHVPSDDEWRALVDYAGGREQAGGALKTPNWGGSNALGFSALPGGYRDYSFHEGVGRWWTYTNLTGDPQIFTISHNDNSAIIMDLPLHYYYYRLSVRCVWSGNAP